MYVLSLSQMRRQLYIELSVMSWNNSPTPQTLPMNILSAGVMRLGA
ncbi:hypothetical protein NT01EI_1956 [Edwardsiella ictaluri 93-146]|uniref:Uncharacterized protein n=1 Tax=Edwardsiella ictaluri (strain 93-146) TaxID=634503 RepID=C5BA11_EDWI9|nr:hypothetical protein NT01EI_1956 [Edwardsiella ictaluri 93-146]